MPDPVSLRLAAAIELAQDAGRLTLRYFQSQHLSIERKGDDSPVTQADREAEQHLRHAINRQFPGDAIVGEEFGEQPGKTGFTWILDPIDGTKSFIAGVPLYSQLIGILNEQESVAGVISLPALDECVFAAKGQGAWWRKRSSPPQRAFVSTREKLSDGIFTTSQVDCFATRGAEKAFERLSRATYVTRTWGDGYGYLLVATGRAEVMVDAMMSVWDAAAILPVITEAGGTFSDWNGIATVHGGEGVATNGRVFEEVMRITRDYPKPS